MMEVNMMIMQAEDSDEDADEDADALDVVLKELVDKGHEEVAARVRYIAGEVRKATTGMTLDEESVRRATKECEDCIKAIQTIPLLAHAGKCTRMLQTMGRDLRHALAVLQRIQSGCSEITKLDGGCECCICLQSICQDRKPAIKLPCSHIFHRDCVTKWLMQDGVCPMCRFQIHTHKRKR